MASCGVQSQLFASQPSTGGASHLVIVNDGSVSVAASLPAADICHLDRGDPPDGALLLHRRHLVGPCACRTVACTFTDLDSAAPHRFYPNAFCGAHVHTYRDTHTHRDAETGSQRYFYRHHCTYPDLHTLRHAYAHCHGHSDQHPDANQHVHCHADAFSHADAHTHLDPDGYIHAEPDTEPHTDAKSDTERHAHAKPDAEPHAGNDRPAATVGSWARRCSV